MHVPHAHLLYDHRSEATALDADKEANLYVEWHQWCGDASWHPAGKARQASAERMIKVVACVHMADKSFADS